MVIIDQFRISDDGSMMIVDAHVSSESYYLNMYISKVMILTADQMPPSGSPSSIDKYVFQRTYSLADKYKQISLRLTPAGDFNENFTKANLSSDLFYLVIWIDGTPAECAPCGSDEPVIAATFDYMNLYNRVMNYTRELNQDCEIPRDFINFILNYEAFKIAVETDHVGRATDFYNQMFGTMSVNTSVTKGCGCYG